MIGKLYVIGVGPGDSQLMTVKAVNLIKNADIIAVPCTEKNKESLAQRIAMPFIEDESKIKQYIFPMVKDREIKQKYWDDAASDVICDIRDGKNVVFLVLGDPTVYSTYMYLDEQIKVAGITPIIVPGVTAFTAIAAVAGKKLVEDKERFCVVSGISDFDDLETIIKLFDTIIIMKAGIKFKEIVSLLEKLNLVEKAVLVSDATMESQQIFDDLIGIGDEKLSYFSTMIIKK